MNSSVFIDTSALIALYVKNDDFHFKAISYWEKAKRANYKFLISNFIFEELTTWLCYKKNKQSAMHAGNYLLANEDILPIKPVLPEDEKEAWKLFCKLPERLSFTDCTSFAIMRRFRIKSVFTFDKHFAKAGFKIMPQ